MLANLQRMLYRLKRSFGHEADLYRLTSSPSDLETGAKTVAQTKYHLDLAVVIPYRSDTVGFYSSALLKAARQFSYGGFQDEDIKNVIIDGADLPDDFDVRQDDVFMYRHVRYEIKVIERLEENAGYNLLVLALKGVQPNEIHEQSVYQTVRFVQSNAGVL